MGMNPGADLTELCGDFLRELAYPLRYAQSRNTDATLKSRFHRN